MLVGDIMSSPVVVVQPEDSLARVRNLMLRNRISRVVVTRDERPIGVVTKADIARCMAEISKRIKSLDEVSVCEVMTSPVIVIGVRDSIRDAAKEMLSHGISGLPVVDSLGYLVGIVTKTDITRYYAENCSGIYKVSELMEVEVPTVQRGHTIYRVIDVLQTSSVDRVVVVDGKSPVGIITHTDISFIDFPLRKERKFIRVARKITEDYVEITRFYYLPTAEEVMSSPVITIARESDAKEAASLMLEHEIGGLPVVDRAGSLVGIILKSGFIKALSTEKCWRGSS